MLSVAVRVPAAAGVNITAIVQVPPAATDDPQVSASVKSEASAPVKARLDMVKLALPVLFKVTTCEELVTSSASFPKDRLVVERLTTAPLTEKLNEFEAPPPCPGFVAATG